MQVENLVSKTLLVVGAITTASGLSIKIAQNIRKALDCLKDSKKEGEESGKSKTDNRRS